MQNWMYHRVQQVQRIEEVHKVHMDDVDAAVVDVKVVDTWMTCVDQEDLHDSDRESLPEDALDVKCLKIDTYPLIHIFLKQVALVIIIIKLW